MSVIHIDFRDKEQYRLIRLVEAQLASFGLDSMDMSIPEDAIACALDEVKKFPSAADRKTALVKLEKHFRLSREAAQPLAMKTAQVKPKP